MHIENVFAVYFSATGNSGICTEAAAREIARISGAAFCAIDLTIWKSQPPMTEFGNADLVVFGAPVYAGRIYAGARERFRKMRGDHTPCVVTVSYGNRHFDDALLELADLAAEQGFLPFAAAALIGRHTYGEIQTGRPDAADLMEIRAFAGASLEKYAALGPAAAHIPGDRPFRKGGNGGRFRPLTGPACISCGICARDCPEGAISDGDFSSIDTNKCISCFRCIRRCPVGAKYIDSNEYITFAADFTKKLEARRENEFFL